MGALKVISIEDTHPNSYNEGVVTVRYSDSDTSSEIKERSLTKKEEKEFAIRFWNSNEHMIQSDREFTAALRQYRFIEYMDSGQGACSG